MFKQLLVAAFTLTATAALAAPKNITLERGNTVTVFHGHVTGTVATRQHDPKKQAIFTNLTQPYDCCEGWTLSGSPSSPIGETLFLAEGFTPTKAATATEIDVAVGWVTGSNGVTIGLYSDNNGVPGTQLWSKTVKNLDEFGTSSSSVGVGKIKGGVALSAGTQYWVTLTFTKKYANEWAAWNFTEDNDNAIPAAVDTGSGWTATQLQPGGGFAVYE
jgi:hypothetical protein